MSIVINQAAGGIPFEAGASYLGHDNFFLRDDASVSADSEDTDQAISNATSWPTYGGGWQTSVISDHTAVVSFPQTESGQGYAIHKHNFGDLGLTVKLQNSQDGAVWSDISGSEQTPANNKTLFFIASDSETAPFWRVFISGHSSGTMRVAQIFIGPVLRAFQSPGPGWSPPNLALNNTYITSRSDGGDFLGRSLIRKGSKTRFTMQAVRESWLRSDWVGFMEAAEEHPFYYSWDSVNFPKEVAYCYVDKKIEIPRYVSHRHMNVPLSFVALQV